MNLYQFPLVETKKRLSISTFKSNDEIKQILSDKEYSITLYNDQEIIHKLSHQHLYTSFWIVTVNELPDSAIEISTIHDFPVPVLINNFIEAFGF